MNKIAITLIFLEFNTFPSYAQTSLPIKSTVKINMTQSFEERPKNKGGKCHGTHTNFLLDPVFNPQDLPSVTPANNPGPGEANDAPAKQSSGNALAAKPNDPNNPFTPEKGASLLQPTGEPTEKELRDLRQPVVDGSKPLRAQFEAAIDTKNIPTATKLRDTMVRDFPTSPLTFQAQVQMSIAKLDLAELDAVLADTQQSPILTYLEKLLFKKHYGMLKPALIDEKKKKADLPHKR